MSKSNKKNNGISMVEAVLATGILMIGVLSIINIFPLTLKLARNGEQETIAANLAQAKIEEMFQLGYDNITIGTIETKQRLSSSSSNPFYYYQRKTDSFYVDSDLATSTLATGLKRVNVTVYWTTPHLNIEKSLLVSTLISQR